MNEWMLKRLLDTASFDSHRGRFLELSSLFGVQELPKLKPGIVVRAINWLDWENASQGERLNMLLPTVRNDRGPVLDERNEMPRQHANA